MPKGSTLLRVCRNCVLSLRRHVTDLVYLTVFRLAGRVFHVPWSYLSMSQGSNALKIVSHLSAGRVGDLTECHVANVVWLTVFRLDGQGSLGLEGATPAEITSLLSPSWPEMVSCIRFRNLFARKLSNFSNLIVKSIESFCI